VAWVDFDGDGDADLSVANNQTANPDRLFENTGGALTLSSAWSPSTSLAPNSHAWADVDGDGDLDLAQAVNNGASLLWTNDAGLLNSSTAIPGTGSYIHNGIGAWADWDGDGDPDLAMPHYSGEPDQVYGNDGGTLSLAWTSAISEETKAAAWADADGDGDLDLAVAAGEGSQLLNRLYENTDVGLANGGLFGISGDAVDGAWGDWDGDGDLDLAVAVAGGPNVVFDNDGGLLTIGWSSAESDYSRSVAWGDMDGDGDLDLAVGNGENTGIYDPNRVYENDGAGSLTLTWTSPELDRTESVAWSDWDSDGDLDLAVGNHGSA